MTVMHSTVDSNDGNLFVVNYQLLRAEITPTVPLKAKWYEWFNGDCVWEYVRAHVQCTCARMVQYNLYILCSIYKSSYKFV